MNKIEFFTLVQGEDKKPKAVLKQGWSDGICNYYKDHLSKQWLAILPQVGKLVGIAGTLAKAQKCVEAVHEQIKAFELLDTWKNHVETFDTAVRKAKETREDKQ